MDGPNLDEAYKQLMFFRELLADYLEEGAPRPPVGHQLRIAAVDYAQGLERVQLTMHTTLRSVDRCLATIEAITAAGGVGEYIRLHLPPPPPG